METINLVRLAIMGQSIIRFENELPVGATIFDALEKAGIVPQNGQTFQMNYVEATLQTALVDGAIITTAMEKEDHGC